MPASLLAVLLFALLVFVLAVVAGLPRRVVVRFLRHRRNRASAAWAWHGDNTLRGRFADMRVDILDALLLSLGAVPAEAPC